MMWQCSEPTPARPLQEQLAQCILDKERRIADIMSNIKGLLARTK